MNLFKHLWPINCFKGDRRFQYQPWNRTMCFRVGCCRSSTSTTGTVVSKQSFKMKCVEALDHEKTPRDSVGDVVSWTSMISKYAGHGQIEDARQLFDKMPERNVISWNAMIAGYSKTGRLENAFQLFDKMPERNVVSWTTMVTAYAQNGRIEDANRLFGKMPERTTVSWNAMISGYIQNGRTENARLLFDKMPERNLESWNAMIAGYVHGGRMMDAGQLFEEMPERSIVSWTAMIAGYSQNGQGEDALRFFVQIQQAGFKLNQSIFISVTSACASLEALECGYAQYGCGKEALQLFEQMQREGLKPNHVTFVGVLSACSHGGLVDEGWHYFHSMSQDHCITPRMDHYGCMVDLLGRAGHLDEVDEFISKMPFEPDAVVWGALLGACRIHVNLELGQRAAKQLFKLEPQNAATYVVLSNLYAAAGRWDDAEKLKIARKDRMVRKNPGCSWIVVSKVVHTFLIGDRSHPQTEKIYAKLERLAGQMEEAGYVPSMNFVLHDVEELKENIIPYHSEKLAIAYGLISTAPGTPIRIIKNLRVCSDCHNATKFISMIVGREIVVRDSSRFHRFKDGLCSCDDYW